MDDSVDFPYIDEIKVSSVASINTISKSTFISFNVSKDEEDLQKIRPPEYLQQEQRD